MKPNDRAGIRGWVRAELRGPDGKLKQFVETHNLVTDYGDQWAAELCRGAVPANTPIGFKCATDNVAVLKNTVAAYIGSGYIDASYHAFDGWVVGDVVDEIRNTHTWAAGEATATHRRVGFSSDAGNNVDDAETDCIAIANYGADVVKAIGDSLTVTWDILFLGA